MRPGLIDTHPLGLAAVFALFLFVAGLHPAHASDATAEAMIRQEIIEADSELFHKLSLEIPYLDDDVLIMATGWFQGQQLAKIEVEHASSHGSTIEVIYFDGAYPVLADQRIYVDPMSSEPRFLQWSQRFIFENGAPEALQVTDNAGGKGVTRVYSPGQAAFTVRFLEIQDVIQRVKPVLMQARMAEIGPLQVSDGVFLGIEQGDYFHLAIKTPVGEESFFLLRTDETLDRLYGEEEAYIGKPITVFWRTIREMIPEAGGSMDLDVAVAVRLPGDED